MIRKYQEKEIPILMNIWEKAATIAHPFLDAEFTKMVKEAMIEIYLPNSDTWVYENSNAIMGFISMTKNEIGGLFVHPNHHSKGIGTALVDHIKKMHNEIEVEVFEENRIGRSFYEKLEFKLMKTYHHKESNQKVLRLRK